MLCRRRWLAALALALGLLLVLGRDAEGAEIDLVASRDNTIYEESGAISNGTGDYLFTGRTDTPLIRRALLAFDIASQIPQGSTITSVSLTLYCSRTKTQAESVTLHRVLADWGEGTSNAPNEEGQGAPAASNDATWTYRLYNTKTWTSPGGDFVSTASATTSVGGQNSFYSWTSAGMVADVQGWLDNPSASYGWLVRGNETSKKVTKRFDSRSHSDVAKRPRLHIVYTPPVATTGACCAAAGTCSLVTHPGASCTGTYQGSNTSCSPNTCPQPPPPTGACCAANGSCSVVTDPGNACVGAYQGASTTCAPNPCPQPPPPTGACCAANGTCSVVNDPGTSCVGTYQGSNTSCAPNPCAQPQVTGACCAVDGSCALVPDPGVACAGTYRGASTNCAPNVCPKPAATGACCAANGNCTVVADPGNTCAGTYRGASTTCGPNPCPPPPPTGACCLPVSPGACTSVTQTQCSSQGGSFAGGGTTCSESTCPFVLTPFLDPLPRPSVATPMSTATDGTKRYSLSVVSLSQKLHAQLPPTRVWGFRDDATGQASYPGPTLEAVRDVPIDLLWRNDLRDASGAFLTKHALPVETCLTGGVDGPPRTVMHLHGGHIPAAVDGYPTSTLVPGQETLYRYPNHQDAATLWYHDHAFGITRLNVYMGLAGFYLLRSPAEQALGLPASEYEVPLVLQDRVFRPDGSLEYPAMWMNHVFGNVILVNGKVWPYLDVKRGKYRFRILNGSNARTYALALSNGALFQQIGSDSGLLAAPVPRSSLTLGPGERADVIVDFAANAVGTELLLENSAPAPFPGSGGVISNVMKLRVIAGEGHTTALPTKLRTIEALSPEQAVLTRDFTLDKKADPCGGARWLINGLEWESITERPRLGTVETWRFINPTGVSHPMHMHLVQFRVVDRQPFEMVDGKVKTTGAAIPAPPEESGWKDTVVVMPSEIVRVVTRFEDYVGRYAYHCHLLEHEDNMMMRQFETVTECGDGVVGSPQETCDPPSSCPSSCDDGDPCTADRLEGSASTCTARCVHGNTCAAGAGDGGTLGVTPDDGVDTAGCSCRAQGLSPRGSRDAVLSLGIAAALLVLRTRRLRTSHKSSCGSL